MEKTNTQEQKKMNQHHLKTSRYSENFIPEKETKSTEEKHVPDCQNPKRLKELH